MGKLSESDVPCPAQDKNEHEMRRKMLKNVVTDRRCARGLPGTRHLSRRCRPNNDKIAALTCMPMPTDIKQLRSSLGGLSYYRKFLPNMANVSARFWTYSEKEARSALLPQQKKPFTPSLQTSPVHRYLSSSIGTLRSTSLDHSASIAMLAPMASEQRSNRNSLTALSAPSPTLVEQHSLLFRFYQHAHFIPIVGVGKDKRTLVGPW